MHDEFLNLRGHMKHPSVLTCILGVHDHIFDVRVRVFGLRTRVFGVHARVFRVSACVIGLSSHVLCSSGLPLLKGLFPHDLMHTSNYSALLRFCLIALLFLIESKCF